MTRLLCLFSILALPLQAQTADSAHTLTTADKVLAGAAATALLADYSSTEWALARGWYETNPLVGRHPTTATLTAYTALSLASLIAVQAKVAPVYRRIFTATFLAIEGYCVAANMRQGAHLAF